VLKVGESQSCSNQEGSCGNDVAQEAIAKIQAHGFGGRTAATVYVRNIPLLTIIGSTPLDHRNIQEKVAENQGNTLTENSAVLYATPRIKVATNTTSNFENPLGQISVNSRTSQSDPVWRASAIAAKLNQLHRDGVDANTISVIPTPGKSDNYTIQIKGQGVVEIDPQTILPNTTHSHQQDALQITNLLRRLIGNAPPLQEIPGQEKPKVQEIAIGPVVLRVITGWASWYGPGFDGNPSASGELFDANAMTAAHKSLPFGTQVKVTNLDNGRSIIVRINDRGPYAGDRIIDLSYGAAQMLGMLNTGVAPVRLEVLGSQTARGVISED